MKSLAKGDSNTAFFQAIMRTKKKNKKVERMVLENGQLLKFAEEVHDGVVNFFQDLLTSSAVEFDKKALSFLGPSVSVEENKSLCAIPSMDEVKAALWSIPFDSSLGPDGFSACFLFKLGMLLSLTSWDWPWSF